jgi:hypothetical protein
MGERRSSVGTVTVLTIVVVAISILWALVRPDLWAWAFGFAVITITMLTLAHNAGVRQGRECAMSAEPLPQDKEKPEEKTIAEARLEAFETALAEAELFAYELKQGLVPDGNSEDNPGYGPMDFDEWREWKQREFERTENLWHNHPGGLPPKEDDAA